VTAIASYSSVLGVVETKGYEDCLSHGCPNFVLLQNIKEETSLWVAEGAKLVASCELCVFLLVLLGLFS
jgi:hypothetical protein